MSACGGCDGLGKHSPRCPTQPGWHWYRLMQSAESLADQIGPNDMEAANACYWVSGRMRARLEQVEAAGRAEDRLGIETDNQSGDPESGR